MVVKFVTNASGAMWLPNLVTESISGSVVPLAMFDYIPPLVLICLQALMSRCFSNAKLVKFVLWIPVHCVYTPLCY